jgi:hypothetical protein
MCFIYIVLILLLFIEWDIVVKRQVSTRHHTSLQSESLPIFDEDASLSSFSLILHSFQNNNKQQCYILDNIPPEND